MHRDVSSLNAGLPVTHLGINGNPIVHAYTSRLLVRRRHGGYPLSAISVKDTKYGLFHSHPPWRSGHAP